MAASVAAPDSPQRGVSAGGLLSFAVAGSAVAYLGLDGGGYDLLTRQQFAVAVWALIGLGFAFGVLPRARPGRLAGVALALAVAYLAWMALSLTWTAGTERTTAEIARALGYIGVVSLILATVNRDTFRSAAAGVTVAAAAVVMVAIASRLFPSEFPGAADIARLFRADRLAYPARLLERGRGLGGDVGRDRTRLERARPRLACAGLAARGGVPSAALARLPHVLAGGRDRLGGRRGRGAGPEPQPLDGAAARRAAGAAAAIAIVVVRATRDRRGDRRRGRPVGRRWYCARRPPLRGGHRAPPADGIRSPCGCSADPRPRATPRRAVAAGRDRDRSRQGPIRTAWDSSATTERLTPGRIRRAG